MPAAVLLFVYNRPHHTLRTLHSLNKCIGSQTINLYVFSDAAKNKNAEKEVVETRKVVEDFSGVFNKTTLVKRETNYGLARNIIEGVSQIMSEYGKVIVLEDDLELSSNFLLYMERSLEAFKNNKRIFSVSGYCAPISPPLGYIHNVFLFYRINSWGWATWKDRWDSVDWQMSDFHEFIQSRKKTSAFDKGGEDCSVMLLDQQSGRINSWAIRFNYAAYKWDGYTVYPVISKVLNMGADGSGTHVRKTNKYATELDTDNTFELSTIEIPVHEGYLRAYRFFFNKSIIRKLINLYKINIHRIKHIVRGKESA